MTEYGSIGGKILTGEKRSTRRETINPAWNGLRSNPGLIGERPATNFLRQGMVILYAYIYICIYEHEYCNVCGIVFVP